MGFRASPCSPFPTPTPTTHTSPPTFPPPQSLTNIPDFPLWPTRSDLCLFTPTYQKPPNPPPQPCGSHHSLNFELLPQSSSVERETSKAEQSRAEQREGLRRRSLERKRMLRGGGTTGGSRPAAKHHRRSRPPSSPAPSSRRGEELLTDSCVLASGFFFFFCSTEQTGFAIALGDRFSGTDGNHLTGVEGRDGVAGSGGFLHGRDLCKHTIFHLSFTFPLCCVLLP